MAADLPIYRFAITARGTYVVSTRPVSAFWKEEEEHNIITNYSTVQYSTISLMDFAHGIVLTSSNAPI